MPDGDTEAAQEPLRVSILRHGGHLVASVHTALDDGQLLRFRHELVDEIGRYRARGVVVDVAALDVIDSFACHTLRNLAQVARLRGADTVVVGIRPAVALAMTRLGTTLHPVQTALDLEEGLDLLDLVDHRHEDDEAPRPGHPAGPSRARSESSQITDGRHRRRTADVDRGRERRSAAPGRPR